MALQLVNSQSSTVKDELAASSIESAPPLAEEEQVSKMQCWMVRALLAPNDAPSAPPLSEQEHDVKLFPQRSPVCNEEEKAITAPASEVHMMDSKLVVLTVQVAVAEVVQEDAMSGAEEVMLEKVVR